MNIWEKFNSQRFTNVMLTKTRAAEAKADGIYVSFEDEKAPAEPQRYDLVFVAVGRSPNGKKIGADKARVAVTDRGFIEVDMADYRRSGAVSQITRQDGTRKRCL